MPPQPTLDDERYEVVETCHSTWVVDTALRRFVRLPRGTQVGAAALEVGAPWTPYDSIVVDPVSGSFMVRLNASGSRILRSMLHRDPCPHCAADAPSSLTLELTAIDAPLSSPPHDPQP